MCVSSVTLCRLATVDPVYAARYALYALPLVVTERTPDAGAVHRSHTEWPIGLPARTGSPGSRDAPTLEPPGEPLDPEIACAFGTLSFAGASVAGCQVSVNGPGA